MAFVFQANPSEREEISGRHLPQVIIKVPVTRQSLHTAFHFAEEALSLPHKQKSAIKSCTSNNKGNLGDGRRRNESPRRRANRTNVTQVALFGTALSNDMSHEILHTATYSAAVRAIMIDSLR